jgi:hypothetical protein
MRDSQAGLIAIYTHRSGNGHKKILKRIYGKGVKNQQ